MQIHFRESTDFYRQLDEAVKAEKPVTVIFSSELPDQRSKLWPRLKRCKNWNDIEGQLQRVADGKAAVIGYFLSPGMKVALAGGELLLIGFIATLIAGVFMYGIYKGRSIELDGTVKPPKLVLKVT